MITLSQKNHFIKAIKISLLLIALNWVNFAYAQDIKRIRITHNGGADYSLGHLFLFNGATQYVTDFSDTISAGSNDFTFDYNVEMKKTVHGHIENLVRQGNSTNQKYWDGSDYNSSTWMSTGTNTAGRYVEVDFGTGGQPVTDIILTAWVEYSNDHSHRIYNQTITVYDGSDNLIQTYNLNDSIYRDSGKKIFHITTGESDSNITTVTNSLPDDKWNNNGSKAVYTLSDLTDTTSPTLSSSTPADNAIRVAIASNIVLTFSEAVDVETGNIILYKKDGTSIETFDVATSGLVTGTGTNVITINPTANLDSSTGYYLKIDASAFDDAAGRSYAGITNTTTLSFTTVGSDPTSKTDVTASIKAMSGIAIDAVAMNFTAVDSRVAWLGSNINSNKLSHQGIALRFANPMVDRLMNTQYVKPGKLSPTNKALELLRNNLLDGTPDATAMSADTKAQLNSAALNEAAKLRQNTLDKVLKATGGSIMGDWNVWTEGRITVGKTYSTDTSSAQDSQTQNVSLGFDRIVKDDAHPELDGHIVGVVLGIGKSDANTTDNSTVDADSYSLSAYGVIRQNDKALVQAMMGYGHINVDKTRIDGSDTLTGTHNANQFFTSLMLKKETIGIGSFSLSPYGKIHASRTWYDGYSESGGATALTYGEQTIDSTVLSTGIDVNYMIPINKGNIRPFAKFEYGADVSGSSTVNMHYNNEITNYQLQLDNKADSNWKFVLGTDVYTKDEWDSSISYERTEAVDAGYSDSLAVKVGLKF